jgi:glycosyltransferase involved in cell wall biosynthesis
MLGHRCDIASFVDNFTWFEHRPVINYIPKETDVLIAASCSDVVNTITSPVKKKAWYIRAHETWAMDEPRLAYHYQDKRIANLVNSEGLKRKIDRLAPDMPAKVIYQGIDFNWWGDRNLRGNDKIRIGCLHTKQPRKRWKDFVKLAKILGHDHYEYVAMGSSLPKEDFPIWFALNPTVDKLNDLYSSCHIWFAPTDNEGLHNVPMEAALCGCLIVCSDHPLNGMVMDYAFKSTSMIYKFGDLEQAARTIKNPDWRLIGNMQEYLRSVIGTREENMKKLVECLEGL